MEARAEIFSEPDAVAAVRAAWDALATEQSMPCSAPAWCLAWWRHAAPAGAVLRVVVVYDGPEVIGVAPMYCHRDAGVARYGFLGDQVSSPVGPLARAGAAAPVAAAVAGALASAAPRPDIVAFGNLPADDPWPGLLRAHWPGRALALRRARHATPYLALEGTYDAWVAAQSRNFRQQLRRHRRRLESRGAVFRLVEAGEREEYIAEFARLHHARFEGRGGSAVMTGGVMRMLVDAGGDLMPDGRLQLWVIEAEGKVISAHLLLAAGGRVTYWLGGFDDSWASDQPALQALAAALEHAYGTGREVFDLGPGLQDYKLRFAKDVLPGVEVLVVPAGGRRLRTLARVAPPRLREVARRRLRAAVPQEVKDLVRSWVARVRGAREGSAPLV
ncbi:MAG TPA: GNAT family N-acetyltransferase [Euzebyales bacterium]|nr:GNAT family N-acetyltransferase [Euzebyales bacterium]